MLVSVLMPVRNAEAYIGEAIESILNQTLCDFEFIIINGDSTDRTAEILAAYERQDQRVHVYSQEVNHSLVAGLNKALELAKGRYFARMDADDISFPTRLEKQVAFLEAHQGVGVCGSWRLVTGGRVIRYPVEDRVIRSYLIFDTLLAHSTVMMRRELFESGIRYAAYEGAEDYALWTQLAEHTSFANLPEVLLYYRSHPQQVGQKHRREQMEAARRVREAQLKKLGISPTAKDIEIHQAIAEGQFRATSRFIVQSEMWLRMLMSANQRQHYYPEPEFSQLLAQCWFAVCKSVALGIGFTAGLAFWRSPLRRVVRLNVRQLGLLIGRCALGHWLHAVRRVSVCLRRAGQSYLGSSVSK